MKVIRGIAVSAGLYTIALLLWSAWLHPAFVEFRHKDLIGQSISTKDFLRNNPDAFLRNNPDDAFSFGGKSYEEMCGNEPESQNYSVVSMRVGNVVFLPIPLSLNTYLRVCFGRNEQITGLKAIRELDGP